MILHSIVGILLGLGVGAFCRYVDIPSPAPPRFLGACVLLAMTVGFVVGGIVMHGHPVVW